MTWIIVNDEFQRADQCQLSYQNRAFLYGDGLFETMRTMNGRLHLWHDHRQRILSSLQTLSIEPPTAITEGTLPAQIGRLAKANQIKNNARVRLTVFRDPGGLYTPANHTSSYLLDVQPLQEDRFALQKDGLVIGIYEEPLKIPNKLASLKSVSALAYVYAGVQKQQEGVHDMLIKNTHHRLAEAISSNIFIVTDQILFTPPLSEGCVAGVMRQHLIRLAQEAGYDVLETQLHIEAPLFADEMLLTNAIHGIQWAGIYQWKRYMNTTAKQLADLLNAKREDYSVSIDAQ